ncbi:CDP-diacylglycerol--glycerol-3-phosphate 3-phosphatidyltransferase [Candidatus Marinimicrobia bacterium MT.SAG.3]|nr:CDP-diacylglycerol--glycerol-3-phosphate 3-phosphatidyltransferase [Candidatus Marinimicrobia bacterium MT.SAG.3]
MTLPNQLTIFRLALTPLFFILMVFSDTTYSIFIATIVFLIASLTDAYDGFIARKYGTVTRWGAFLDPLADKILISAAFVALMIKGYLSLWMILIVIARDAMVTLIRAFGLWKNKPIKTERFAKWKTSLQIIIVGLLLLYDNMVTNPFGKTLSPESQEFIRQSGIIDAAMFVIVLLTVYSGISYVIGNRKFVKQMAIGIYRTILNS